LLEKDKKVTMPTETMKKKKQRGGKGGGAGGSEA
jgi:hypothetical protein